MDDTHAEVVSVFAPMGYHILCEKPMANSIEDCVRMVNSVKGKDLVFGIGHGKSDLPSSNLHPSNLLMTHFSLYL